LRAQLAEYFAGTRRDFELPLEPGGCRATPFQRDVWKAIATSPCGVTTTYSALANSCGRPAAVRASGAATGRNPISLVIPCHRVVGSDGSLTGYAGGLERKRKLLALEQGALFA
jgi:methylated-DNA-[protein]-cysteine S-methyltransferase